MPITIQSACVSLQHADPPLEFQYQPGINILWGDGAEETVLTLAHLFSGKPRSSVRATVCWSNGATLVLSAVDEAVFVREVRTDPSQPPNHARLVKAFHKKRFLDIRKKTHIFDGSIPIAAHGSEGSRLLEGFFSILTAADNRPLFVCNFLERLDEATDLKSLFTAMQDTGRQILIAVPRYYPIQALKDLPFEVAIPTDYHGHRKGACTTL